MLVLSRKVGEVIWIGDDVSVMVVDVRGDKVRLGISAPRDVDVHREEIVRKIEDERSWIAVATAGRQ